MNWYKLYLWASAAEIWKHSCNIPSKQACWHACLDGMFVTTDMDKHVCSDKYAIACCADIFSHPIWWSMIPFQPEPWRYFRTLKLSSCSCFFAGASRYNARGHRFSNWVCSSKQADQIRSNSGYSFDQNPKLILSVLWSRLAKFCNANWSHHLTFETAAFLCRRSFLGQCLSLAFSSLVSL